MGQESKAKTVSIKATSRVSVKVKDSFYTVEWCEERTVPEDAELAQERETLWDTVNMEVDKQVEEILKMC